MKHFFFKIEILFSIIALVITGIVSCGQVPVANWNPVKALLMGIYYFFLYTEEWLRLGIFLLSVIFALILIKVCKKLGIGFEGNLLGILISTIFVMLCFFMVVLKIGNMYDCSATESLLKLLSFIWWELCLIGMMGWDKKSIIGVTELRYEGLYLRWMPILLMITCLPVAYAGKFVYPQADDFSYGAYCYQAFHNGEGVFGVLAGAGRKVVESYAAWQGTFSSIFLMALQPGVWGTEFYHLVPGFLVTVLVTAILFFFYVVLHQCCLASKAEAIFVGSTVSIWAVQMAVAKLSAFFWYNGAVHYLFAFCMLLNFVSMILYLWVAGKKNKICIVGACLTGVMVGGGNLVTSLLGMIILTGFLGIFVFMRNKRAGKYLILPGGFMITAFLLNILAPGNAVRQSKSGEIVEYGVIGSVLKSFQVCLDYVFSDWINWYWLLFLLLLLPVLRGIANRMKFRFPVPGLVALGSYCLLSSMFTPLIYALGHWDTGRILNIIYFMFLILSALNEFYIIGWLDKREKAQAILSCRKMQIGIMAVISFYLVLDIVAEPGRFTSGAVIESVCNGEADAWAEVISNNMAILENSEEDNVVLKRPPQSPEIFTTLELDPWRMGTPLYYDKQSVCYEDELYQE